MSSVEEAPAKQAASRFAEEEAVFSAGNRRGKREHFAGGRILVVAAAVAVLVVTAVGGVLAAPAYAADASTIVPTYSEEELEFVRLLNAFRVSHGVNPVAISDNLSKASQAHSEDMAKYLFFDHYTVESDYFDAGASPWERMDEAGYPYVYETYLGENIGAGQPTGQLIFDGFRTSPPHKETMLSPNYKVIGVAQVPRYHQTGGYDWYWTVDFAGKVDDSAHGSATYQQGSSKITYLGSWRKISRSDASGGSLNTTGRVGSGLLVKFTGTSIELIGRTAAGYGMAEIKLDNGAWETYNFYSPTTQYKVSIHKWDELDYDTHTLAIRASGEKDAASSGFGMGIDAFHIYGSEEEMGTLEQADVPVRVEENDENPTFTGDDDWTTAYRDDASGDYYVTTRAPGSAVNVQFEGRYLAWYARTTPRFGKAVVVVDAGTEDEVTTTVDLWSWKSKDQRKVFDTGLLDYDDHTVSIYYRGKKNWLSTGTTICVDAFEVIGNLVPADPAPLHLFTDTYQQGSSKITYLGRWRTAYKSKASGGSLVSTSTVGAAAVIEFTGTDITALVRTAPWYGIAGVTLDGVEQEEVDFYSPTSQYKQPLIQMTGLDPETTHTLTIECTGDMNESASGRGITLDALVVTGYLTQAPTLTRFQQDEGEDDDSVVCSYSSPEDWRTSSSYKFAGGTSAFNLIDDPSVGVTVTFTGTYATIVSKVAPSYGVARVVVDEGEPGEEDTTADYYRSTRKFKKTVFRTGILTPGEHTLTIYYSGNKNPASSGTTIGVDAIDVLVVEP